MYLRVIKIRPSTTLDSSDTIACDFSILDVNNGWLYNPETASARPGHVEYVALSYTWGDADLVKEILLDGELFHVRENLWDFLNRARQTCLMEYLWIDALCINQSKAGEGNHQVAMMGDIYSRAERVIVWLVIRSAEIEDAMDELRMLHDTN